MKTGNFLCHALREGDYGIIQYLEIMDLTKENRGKGCEGGK